MDMDRRKFFRVAGTLGVAALFGGTLTGCSITKAEAYNKEEVENWSKTGNTKTYKAYEHVIWKFENFDGENDYLDQNNGELNIPKGYAYVSSETIIQKRPYGASTQGIKYNFVNTVDVEAEEYVDKNGNIAYPVAGTPLDLEKAAEEPKVLVR